MTHELKILPEYFEAVRRGIKTFELRRDRAYQIGDEVWLREWKPGYGYTGRDIARDIVYILKDCPEYGLEKGYCILGLEVLNTADFESKEG